MKEIYKYKYAATAFKKATKILTSVKAFQSNCVFAYSIVNVLMKTLSEIIAHKS
jgi:hypothetical protein